MKDELKSAGVNVGRARLVERVTSALRAKRWSGTAAEKAVLPVVLADGELLAALHEITEIKTRELLFALIAQLIADKNGAATSPFSDDSENPSDGRRATVDSSRASQDILVGRVPADRPSRSISTSAAKSVARSSVFDQRIIETFDHRWGDITQHDYLNLKIKNAFSAAVERGLSKIIWPDMHTPLRKFASESTVKQIVENANAARQQQLTAVKAGTK